MSDATIAQQTGIPLPFVAGIRATESGGNAHALRFEPHLFRRYHADCVRVLHPTEGAAFVTGDEERRETWACGLVPYTPGKDRAASASALETGREALTYAMRIDGNAGLRSTSLGTFQVLGVHLLPLAKTPEAALEVFDAAPQSVSDELLVRWLRATPKALAAAKAGEIDLFIHLYNGCALDDTARYRKRFDPAYVRAGGKL